MDGPIPHDGRPSFSLRALRCVQTGGVPEKTEIRHNGETMQSRHQKAIQEHSHTTSVTYRIFMDIFTPLSKWRITTSLASLSFDVIWVCARSFSPRAASKEERCDIFKIAKEAAIHPGKQSPPPSQPYPSSCSGKTKEGFLCTFSRAGEEKKENLECSAFVLLSTYRLVFPQRHMDCKLAKQEKNLYSIEPSAAFIGLWSDN